jgi:hypothetical protein
MKRNGMLLIAALLCGCTVVGPSAIRNGRMAYNEAILATNNEQLLMVAIHDRYQENASLLVVASVTANVHTTNSAAVEAGFGGGEDYKGNLVPFSAEMVYEENPTISYVPVAGAKYTRQVMSPISIATLAQFSGTLEDPSGIYWAFVSSVNGIANPDFSAVPADPRFERFVTLMTELSQVGCLHWVESSPGDFAIAIERCGAEHVEQVAALLDVLGIPVSHATDAGLVLPVGLALQRNADTDIDITLTTRSIVDLMELLSASIDVPQDDLDSGAARRYAQRGAVASRLRVAYSKGKPKSTAVVVPYRDGWFYIDERDQVTKRFFRLLTTLWTITLADNTGTSNAPVLTIPVSR